MGHGHLDFNLFPNRFQESIFHPLTRLQIPAQVKPLLSLYGTEWRERGYGLRAINAFCIHNLG
jgi:hypothetical protein